MYAHLNTTHKLVVTLTGRKNGCYKYQIVNKSTGAVESERFSNRPYVAGSAPTGSGYYGRVDLAKNAADKNKIHRFDSVIAYIEDQPPFEIK